MSYKHLVHWSRLIHIYVSSGLFGLLIFFCLTGIALNHLDWISGEKQDSQIKNTLHLQLFKKLSADAPYDSVQQLTQYFQDSYQLALPENVEWDDEFQELTLDYPLPAGYAFISVNYATGEYVLDAQTGTSWQILADLHKGRHSGYIWRLILDISSGLIVLFAITGLILLWQNRKKRQVGSWIIIFGMLSPWLIYLLTVPRITGI